MAKKKKTQPLLPSAFKITLNVLLGVIGLWLAGLLIFFFCVATADPKHPEANTDVVIVLTGGSNRIEEGLRLMADDRAKAMLVTGVHPNVTREMLINRWNGGEEAKIGLLKHCCVFIEHKAASTEDNAEEALAWLNRNGGPRGVNIRLVTSDYHMPRAKLLFRRAMPDAQIYTWPVKTKDMMTRNFMRTLVTEYVKTFLTWLS